MSIKRCSVLLLLLTALAATAQDEPLPEYQVEMIVVRNLNPSTGTEVFPLFLEQEESELEAERMVPLDPSEFTLSSMAANIGRSKNFRVLSHLGWVQPGYSRDQAKRKIVLRNATTGEMLSGHVVMTRERYLRLAFDLTLQVEGDIYHLDSQRRMISRQVHYFDNPFFGVIAKITPL